MKTFSFTFNIMVNSLTTFSYICCIQYKINSPPIDAEYPKTTRVINDILSKPCFRLIKSNCLMHKKMFLSSIC